MSTTIFNLKTMRPIARGWGVVAPPGCVAVSGLHDMEMSRLVERSDDFGEALYSVEPTLPPRPADSAVRTWEWDEVARDWVPSLTLDGYRAARWAVIKAARNQAEVQPLQVAGRVYDADTESQRRIAGAVQLATLAPPGWSLDWTLADNSVATLTAAEVVEVGVALGAQVAAAHATGRALRAQLAAATTVQQIDSIAWPSP